MARRKIKTRTKNILVYLAVILLIFLVLNVATVLVNFSKDEKVCSSKTDTPKKTDSLVLKQEGIFIRAENSTIVSMRLPAVDPNGTGVSTELVVEAKHGTGKTLVDIEGLLFWADTQQSIRMARYVAGNISGINPDNYDITYSVKANASVIGGPSAGAALVLATIFALEGKKPREDVMITGTINHDGSIGPVSAIVEKAEASKEAGAKIFLVPLLQSNEVSYETVNHCQNFGSTEVCTSETKPKKVDVAEQAGIEVVEVSNVQEALKYFEPAYL